jgi:hypothetical protein
LTKSLKENGKIMSSIQTTSDGLIFSKIVTQAQKDFPKLEIAGKADSKFMLFLASILAVFNPKMRADFINNFWTTIKYKVYCSGDQKNAQTTDHWWTLIHELVHCWQSKRLTFPLFMYLYLFPVSQGVLSILFSWIPFLFFGLTIKALSLTILSITIGIVLCIPQLPDPFRTMFEYKAYQVSLYCYYLRFKQIDDEYIERLVRLFSDMSYYKMCNADTIRAKLTQTKHDILHGIYNSSSHKVLKYLP